MKKKIWFPIFTHVILFIVICWSALQLAQFLFEFGGRPWDRDVFNRVFSLPIPENASKVVFAGHTGRGGGIRLYFEVSSESEIEYFVDAICPMGLYKGFDPFNWQYTLEGSLNAIRFVEGYNSFLVFSPNTSITLEGNRCLSARNYFAIRIDKSQSNYISVYLETIFTCKKCQFE